MVTLFLSFDAAAPARLPDFDDALVYTPARASDPYLDDGAPPLMVIQAYFEWLSDLDAFCERHQDLPCAAEAMSVRRFPVPEPELAAEPYCTYLVGYAGPARDEAAWHAHYLERHPPIMARLPGIRRLEVYLPIEWRCPSSWRRVRHMQRNKVVFDSPEALTAALESPVRREMRDDYAKLPPFSGRVTHFPMATRVLSPAR